MWQGMLGWTQDYIGVLRPVIANISSSGADGQQLIAEDRGRVGIIISTESALWVHPGPGAVAGRSIHLTNAQPLILVGDPWLEIIGAAWTMSDPGIGLLVGVVALTQQLPFTQSAPVTVRPYTPGDAMGTRRSAWGEVDWPRDRPSLTRLSELVARYRRRGANHANPR